MDIPIEYNRMKKGDEKRVFTFIEVVFNQFVAPEYSQEGIDEFMKYIQPGALEEHLASNHFGILASAGSQIIGVIMVRDNCHIALFFVAFRHQKKGIGKELLNRALQVCKKEKGKRLKITVNSSPNSIKAYESLNFEQTKSEQCINGIRFIPMVMNS